MNILDFYIYLCNFIFDDSFNAVEFDISTPTISILIE